MVINKIEEMERYRGASTIEEDAGDVVGDCVMERKVLPRGAIVPQNELKKVFGNRKLEDESMMYNYNAWDEPEWTEEDEEKAQESMKFQEENPVPEDKRIEYSKCPEKYWNEFYMKHENRFFKDRKWLPIECPELFYDPHGRPIIKPMRILEVGCGVGNTIIPILEHVGPESNGLFIQGMDYSQVAVDIAKGHDKYDENKWDAVKGDISSETFNKEMFNGKLFDVCFCIFVLSAIDPARYKKVVENIYDILKPGGIVIVRDYGRNDMVQLRFRKERLMGKNYYIRGDGTCVYFFSKEDLSSMFTEDKFEQINNSYDWRLLLNRSRMIKMHRIWISAKFRKR